ncbi:acyl-ACP--UDP-N-acetylglucosamine O-acyltransferase [Oryzomicrobium sp.]|uniref:acyl-ACP--UDP-N-acetylglucosamine O-acyltransferase n=1 Tax=Oryzomicrobium sp. TaxID=1911578 RepID=UPI0025F041E1|nr:acyl-ACP--UDP-N-acetylglucosamine O-acyltransferase [Oryzomicrobium sp.]MCE1242793.1 acyl-ACP--UDP-N-acetylglucosamine O-acyltransferase [Oryzomicrobium sp.]
MTQIHPTAVVSPGARLGDKVSIGPYSVIGENVVIGDNTSVGSHTVIEGHTEIGRDNQIHHFCALGGIPQDKKYDGEPTKLVIGDRNTIREFCSFHTGTIQDAGETRIGNDNWIMGYVHIAHDCVVGNHTIFASNAQIAGHVHVEDWVILGGMTGVHQFVHIGAHAMTGGGTILFQDLPPYVMAVGNNPAPKGINSEGLKRRGFSPESVMAIKRAYRTLYRSGLTLEEARDKIAAEAGAHPELAVLVDFLAQSKRGILR